ncbi:hypothetical protein BDV06DRAFT_200992 [Aspergillus oleicola]
MGHGRRALQLPPQSLEEDEDGHPNPSLQEVKLGNLISGAAEQVPYAHPAQMRLARVVNQLARTDRCTKLVDIEDYKKFESMDSFRQNCGERGDRSWYSESEAKRLLNTVAFQARPFTIRLVDHTPNKIWVLRFTLEVPASKISPANFSTRVAIAALWVVYGGHAMFNAVIVNTEPLNAMSQWSQTKELHNGLIFGNERWRFWIGRLRKICEDGSSATATPGPTVSDEARQLGLKAVKPMEALAETVEDIAI